MVDIKLVRSNPDLVKEAVRKRNKDMDEMIDQIIVIDAQRRETASQVETLKAEQNQASREIPRIKKEGGGVSAIMARMKEIVEEVKAGDAKLSALEEQQKDLRCRCRTSRTPTSWPAARKTMRCCTISKKNPCLILCRKIMSSCASRWA